MTRHIPDAGSYAPVTILIEETPDGGTRVAYDSVASALAPYDNAAASTVAERDPPYLHLRLAAVTVSGDLLLVVRSREELTDPRGGPG